MLGLYWGRIVAVFVCISLVGCTTTRAVQVPFSEPDALAQKVVVGDELEIVHENGQVFRFTVDKVDQWSVSGDGNTILWESIEKLRIREFSKAKTAGVSAVLVAGVVILLGAIAFSGVAEEMGESLSCIFGCSDDDD